LDAAKRTAEKSKAVTLVQAFDDFKATRTLKKTTLREYERSMITAFADWNKRKVIDISFATASLSVDQLNKQFCCRGWLFT
jgi:hypothetical protein